MKKGLVALTALTVMGLCTSAVLAENRAGALTLTPVIGGYHWDGTQGVDANMLYGLNAGYNFTDRLGLEVLLHYVHTKEYSGGYGNTFDTVNYRLEGLYNFIPQNRFVPFLAVGVGGLRSYFNAHNYDDSALFSYGGGAKYALSDNVAIRADARMMSVYYNPSVVYNYEYTLGLNFQFGGASKTAKPVEMAAAPKQSAVEPAPAPKVVAAPKQPVAPPVAVAPKEVAPAPVPVVVTSPAPTAQLVATPASVEKSNTSTLNWSAQNSTECNILPGVGPVQPSGSMVVSPASSTTYKLLCKGKGGSAESTATVTVVQPALDSDKDGVPDEFDKCPDTPTGAKVDNSGCPIPECKSLTLSLTFETNKADIKKKYHDELKAVADKLKSFPKATTVIEGHTDNVGSASANKKLSQRRADAVKKYLIDNLGIDGSRVSAKGFGDTKPIDSNKSEAGRRNNRRVEAVFACPE